MDWTAWVNWVVYSFLWWLEMLYCVIFAFICLTLSPHLQLPFALSFCNLCEMRFATLLRRCPTTVNTVKYKQLSNRAMSENGEWMQEQFHRSFVCSIFVKCGIFKIGCIRFHMNLILQEEKNHPMIFVGAWNLMLVSYGIPR